jgi:hypothetical protein
VVQAEVSVSETDACRGGLSGSASIPVLAVQLQRSSEESSRCQSLQGTSYTKRSDRDPVLTLDPARSDRNVSAAQRDIASDPNGRT